MIRALVLGRLTNNPSARVSNTGKPFAQAWVRVSMGVEGFTDCAVVCFDRTAIARLMELKKGANVSMSGTLKIVPSRAKEGAVKSCLDLTIDEILSTTPRPSLPGAADLGVRK